MADKWYLRADADGIVIHGFSDDFEVPQVGDVCINEQAGRVFSMQLSDQRGQPLYKLVDSQLIERSEEERYPFAERKADARIRLAESAEAVFKRAWPLVTILAGLNRTLPTSWEFNGQTVDMQAMFDAAFLASSQATLQKMAAIEAATTQEELEAALHS